MEYLLHLAILFSVYAIIAIGLNLIVGFTGLVSLAQAGFVGVGAYTTAIILRSGGNFFLGLATGLIITSILAYLIGLVLNKLKDDYYVLASLGFNYIVFSVFLNWEDLTRGALGIPGIVRPQIDSLVFYDGLYFFGLVFIFLLLSFLLARYITHSSFGRVLKAIREDEKAIQIFGYKTRHFKLAVFVIGSMLAALAGSFYGSFITFIDPHLFNVNISVFLLSIIILGGLANLKGSLVGALFLILLPEFLRFIGLPSDIAGQMRQLIYGLLLVLFMLYRPQGLIGEYKL